MVEFIVLGQLPGTDVYLSFDLIAMVGFPILVLSGIYFKRLLDEFSKVNTSDDQTV